MYSVHQNVQILIALLKKFEIRDLVISAGTRHIPLVFSIEEDEFFHCYSVVDERSAGFFALGLIEQLRRPVAIVCTSGTAAANYVSAVNEAYYQHLPLVVLTSDRNPYYHNQQEDQCINQMSLYTGACKKAVDLPIVRDEKDFWYCTRLVNEALLELNHRESGPVHINFPIDDRYPIDMGTFKFEIERLPEVNKINRLMLDDSVSDWENKAGELQKAKILIIYGQNASLKANEEQALKNFAAKYNCMISTDILSNLHCEYSLDTCVLSTFLSDDELNQLCPDIIITMHGNSITPIKGRLLKLSGKFKHWHVSKEGVVSDPFRCMTDIIECSPSVFFEKFGTLSKAVEPKHDYYESWIKSRDSKLQINASHNDIGYSSSYAVRRLLSKIPVGSNLHISNSNSVRIASYFGVQPGIEVYCNRGTCGIDGSMSTYVAQAYVSSKMAFLIIGDLSFFYDMNALWNQYVCKNTRILLCNNSGGALFHSSYYTSVKNTYNIDRHIAAEHETNARGWAESRGFTYRAVYKMDEVDKAISKLTDSQLKAPVLVEVFTDKEMDIKAMNSILNGFRPAAERNLIKVASKLPDPIKNTIKTIIRKK